MPMTKKLLGQGGMTFTNAFVTNPVCCPSRASILTGLYPHNTQVFNNSRRPGDGGCSPWRFLTFLEHYGYNRFLHQHNYHPIDDQAQRELDLGKDWQLVYDNEGNSDPPKGVRQTFNEKLLRHSRASNATGHEYMTFHSGKYHNEYCCYGPKGWDVWKTHDKNSKFYNYKIIDENWQEKWYGMREDEYLTDKIKDWSLEFLKNYQEFAKKNVQKGQQTEREGNVAPFLMVLSVPAPHNPFQAAPRHSNATQHLPPAPRTPNFGRCGAENSDKHTPVNRATCLSYSQLKHIDESYRGRLGTLMSVDETIHQIHEFIDKNMSMLDNTYFIFTSDNGYHLGQNGLMYEKRMPYETDIRVPFYIKGPGIRPNSFYDGIVLNIDIAPTLVDLAKGFVPPHVDGRSLLPVLFSKSNPNDAIRFVDERFLVEYYGEAYGEHNRHLAIHTSNGEHPAYEHTPADAWNNTYKCIREIERTKGDVLGKIYCEFICFDAGKVPSPCPEGSVEANGEFYNLDHDPWQIKNQWHSLPQQQISKYRNLIRSFSTCQTAVNCDKFRYGQVDL
ncbi:hypothetical protein RFI_10238 [Reticulomyxa filosa]|uniref:Sulfatase N-terminal domain-containing protein n=1 Tax=Reticulomyxa filosa TaxID=46433 RepID=X6NLX7_RETFI|nr:hypothetical protein RFI_10238 [Reticulomyxa filosa]|eukprot:ETO26898.1 hypothetical protein RFI_10238 [Reticulomyxa filosa]